MPSYTWCIFIYFNRVLQIKWCSNQFHAFIIEQIVVMNTTSHNSPKGCSIPTIIIIIIIIFSSAVAVAEVDDRIHYNIGDKHEEDDIEEAADAKDGHGGDADAAAVKRHAKAVGAEDGRGAVVVVIANGGTA